MSGAGAGQQHRTGGDVVKFRVKSSSPSLAEFPASELEAQKTSTKGFVTITNPGELVLELVNGRYDLTQLQLLSHESKIASKIRVYVSEEDPSHFRPVGYLELDDNTSSGFMARELQCVQLNCSGVSKVWLVLVDPHINQLNPERHMGIVGLNLIGYKHVGTNAAKSSDPSSVTTESVRSVQSTKDSSSTGRKSLLSETVDIVATLQRKAEDIRLAKDAAVEREDYDEAKRLKAAEVDARRLAETVAELEKSKVDAVQREDYEEAKRIKARLNEIINLGAASSLTSSTPGGGSAGQKHQLSQPSGSSREGSQLSPERPIKVRSSPSKTPRSSSPPVPAHANRPASPLRGYTGADEEGPPEGFWAVLEQQSEGEPLPVAEPLDVHLQSTPEVKILVQAFGMYSTRCLFSAHVKLRAAIIEKISREVEDHATVENMDAVLIAAAMGMQEQAVHVISASVKMVEDAMDRSAGVARHQNLFEQKIIPALLETMANSSAHVQQASTTLFLRLAKVFGVDFAIKQVLNRSPSTKRSTLWRPLHARVTVLKQLVLHFKDFEPSRWTIQLLEWMKTANVFAHANDQVRDAALELTVEIYKKASDRLEVEDFLRNNLRPTSLEKYLNAFANVDGVARPSLSRSISPAAQTRGRAAKDKSSSSSIKRSLQDLNRGGGSHEQIEDEKGGGNDQGDDSYVNGSPSVCHFCLTHDDAFEESEDLLDMHMWRDCPMLGHCPHCNQVIEICNLNEHLLEECDHKSNHRECPRCHEAIAAQSFEKHVRRNACLRAKPKTEANRCPLCHQDIAPFAQGWRQHLMADICPNNVRTMPDEDED